MKSNVNDGIDYENKDDLSRAEKVDLITLPKEIPGTNCFNCKFIKVLDKSIGVGKCQHPEILLTVTERMCCSLWNADGALRSWQKK